AVKMIDDLIASGLRPPVVVADAGYGDTTAFRLGLDERGIGYFSPSRAPPALIPPTRSRSPRPAPPAGHATPARPPGPTHQLQGPGE
ncbi:MAG TPA: transposase, partial [Nakamurella sp.]